MFHFTSSLVGGLAAVTAWALVAPSVDPAAPRGPFAQHESVNRAAKGDRLAVPPLTLRDTPQSRPAPTVAPRNLDAAPAMLVGCEPAASPVAEPGLAHIVGHCISQIDERPMRLARNG